jgi:hypothetical protein
MVSENKDMLFRGDARPPANTIRLVREIAENGEAIVTLTDGRTIEIHGHDSHFYRDRGVIFTESETPDGEDAETWVMEDEIVSVQRH